jgi:hypothetical protein
MYNVPIRPKTFHLTTQRASSSELANAAFVIHQNHGTLANQMSTSSLRHNIYARRGPHFHNPVPSSLLFSASCVSQLEHGSAENVCVEEIWASWLNFTDMD